MNERSAEVRITGSGEPEPRAVDELPPAEFSMIGQQDGRGETINHLYRCTVTTRNGLAMTIRFGAEDEADGIEGAKDFANGYFEELALEYLKLVPDARPAPGVAVVTITLVDEPSGEVTSFDYSIPEEFQPNSDSTGQSRVFYHV